MGFQYCFQLKSEIAVDILVSNCLICMPVENSESRLIDVTASSTFRGHDYGKKAIALEGHGKISPLSIVENVLMHFFKNTQFSLLLS